MRIPNAREGALGGTDADCGSIIPVLHWEYNGSAVNLCVNLKNWNKGETCQNRNLGKER